MKLVKKYPLLLGSSSPQRLNLLKQIGIEVDLVQSPDIDETSLKGELPKSYVERIARAKAESLHIAYKDHIILTGDTIVSVGRRIIGKAVCREEAFKTIQLLSGKSPIIYTAIGLYNPTTKKIVTRRVESKIKLTRIPDEMIDYFLENHPNEWREKAGCFSIMGFMQIYVRSIHGCYSNIVGYPLRVVFNLLQGAGLIGFKK